MCVIAQGEQGREEKRWISTRRCGRLLRNSGENDKNSSFIFLLVCYHPPVMMKESSFDHPVTVLVSLVTLDKAPEDVAA